MFGLSAVSQMMAQDAVFSPPIGEISKSLDAVLIFTDFICLDFRNTGNAHALAMV